MSLIDEALRKAQGPSHSPSVLPDVKTTGWGGVPAASRKFASVRAWLGPVLIGLALLFLTAGVIVWQVWLYITPVPSPTQLELHGVVEGTGEPLAIINGRIVHLGETVEGATLVEVGKHTARLRRRKRDIVLRTAQ